MDYALPAKRRNSRFIDLTGRKVGRLTVISQAHRKKEETYWLCRCECGNGKVVSGIRLRGELTKSCGCIVTEMLQKRNTTHGKSKTKEYRSWIAMKRRCYNRNTLDYPDYGGRGITVCDRWQNDFEAFLEDMGKAPSENHSIDRKDNDCPYEPENCRWSDISTQANNRRNNKPITYEGVTYPSINTFCCKHGLERSLLKYYRNTLKLPLEEAVRRTRIGQGTGGKSLNRFKQK